MKITARVCVLLMGITVITRVAVGHYRNCTRRSAKPQSLRLLHVERLEFSPHSLQSVCFPVFPVAVASI